MRIVSLSACAAIELETVSRFPADAWKENVCVAEVSRKKTDVRKDYDHRNEVEEKTLGNPFASFVGPLHMLGPCSFVELLISAL